MKKANKITRSGSSKDFLAYLQGENQKDQIRSLAGHNDAKIKKQMEERNEKIDYLCSIVIEKRHNDD